MLEIWKDIPGYESKYQASNLGNIKSLLKRRGREGERILKNNKNNSGYYYVDLYINGLKVKKLVHRLILISFKGESKGLQVNHKDGDKSNNILENLEWCTKSENELHKYSVLGHKGVNKGKFGKDSTSYGKGVKVNQYTLYGELIKTWGCMADIERELNLHHSNIGRCCNGKNKTSGGFKWEYSK